jgi:hypothetical protein
MKLYTEEQVKQMIEKSRETGLTAEYLIFTTTPIELPSDEEIREERLLQFPDSEYANRANDRLAFLCGAKYVINKIQGGNK